MRCSLRRKARVPPNKPPQLARSRSLGWRGNLLAGSGVRPAVQDSALLAQFRDGSLPLRSWCHRTHVRVAYLLLLRLPASAAHAEFRTCLQAYNRRHDVPDHLTSGFHETLTAAWLRLVASRMPPPGQCPDSEAFCAANPELLDRSFLRRFYSPERIATWEAKRSFVEPDLQPLPDRRAS
jgi:hypothetical protein